MALIPLNYYLILSAVIFAIGVIGVLVRRNLIVVLMSIELMLNAVNITFIAFSRYMGSMAGQVIVFFVMAVAAAEAVIGLATLSPEARRSKMSQKAAKRTTRTTTRSIASAMPEPLGAMSNCTSAARSRSTSWSPYARGYPTVYSRPVRRTTSMLLSRVRIVTERIWPRSSSTRNCPKVGYDR